jgi:hypothetical protein
MSGGVEDLVAVLAADPDVGRRRGAARTLGELEELPAGAVPALLDALLSNAVETEEISELWQREPPGWGGVPSGRSWPLSADAAAALRRHAQVAFPIYLEQIRSCEETRAAELLARGVCFGVGALDLVMSALSSSSPRVQDAAVNLLGSIHVELDASQAVSALLGTIGVAMQRTWPWAPYLSLPKHFVRGEVREAVRAAWARSELALTLAALEASAGEHRSMSGWIACAIYACLGPDDGAPLLANMLRALAPKRVNQTDDPRGTALVLVLRVDPAVVRVALLQNAELFAWAEKHFPAGLTTSERPDYLEPYARVMVGSRRVEDAFVCTARDHHILWPWLIEVLVDHARHDEASLVRIVDALVDRQIRAMPGDAQAWQALAQIARALPGGADHVVARILHRWDEVPSARGADGIFELLRLLGPDARSALPHLEALAAAAPRHEHRNTLAAALQALRVR